MFSFSPSKRLHFSTLVHQKKKIFISVQVFFSSGLSGVQKFLCEFVLNVFLVALLFRKKCAANFWHSLVSFNILVCDLRQTSLLAVLSQFLCCFSGRYRRKLHPGVLRVDFFRFHICFPLLPEGTFEAHDRFHKPQRNCHCLESPGLMDKCPSCNSFHTFSTATTHWVDSIFSEWKKQGQNRTKKMFASHFCLKNEVKWNQFLELSSWLWRNARHSKLFCLASAVPVLVSELPPIACCTQLRNTTLMSLKTDMHEVLGSNPSYVSWRVQTLLKYQAN